ncbi:MAG TPA: WhiB family transcriptional regulator [Marmoricola sp.]|jgi:WhiB family redox-sensing transcriptional regulator
MTTHQQERPKRSNWSRQHSALEEGLPTSLAQWWASLFEATGRLSPTQRRLLADQQPRGWQDDAVCAQVDPEAWFPPKSVPATPQVFDTCGVCPVRRACLAAALSRYEYGVWAGTTEADRKQLQHQLHAGVPVSEVLDTGLGTDPVAAPVRQGAGPVGRPRDAA